MGTDPWSWIVFFIAKSTTRVLLLIYWILFGGILFLILLVLPSEPKIILRKYFHLVISLMMLLPVLMGEVELTLVAFSVTLSFFLLVEYARVVNIPQISQTLDGFINMYKDNKDSGLLVTTPLYLLVGFALPLVLRSALGYKDKTSLLMNFSGLITIGVADSLSSIFGSLFGTLKWHSRTPKTVQGTIAGFAGTYLINMLLILVLGIHDEWLTVIRIPTMTLASAFVCLMEAATDQIDNLFLPLFYFTLLNLSISL